MMGGQGGPPQQGGGDPNQGGMGMEGLTQTIDQLFDLLDQASQRIEEMGQRLQQTESDMADLKQMVSAFQDNQMGDPSMGGPGGMPMPGGDPQMDLQP